jgi:hypothetical protein
MRHEQHEEGWARRTRPSGHHPASAGLLLIMLRRGATATGERLDIEFACCVSLIELGRLVTLQQGFRRIVFPSYLCSEQSCLIDFENTLFASEFSTELDFMGHFDPHRLWGRGGFNRPRLTQPCVLHEVGFGLSRGPFSTCAGYFVCAHNCFFL